MGEETSRVTYTNVGCFECTYNNVSNVYLSSMFKKETGKTITEYIREKRLSYAVYLLRSTNLQIQTIALRCGIVDVQYFSKLFKKFFRGVWGALFFKKEPPTEHKKFNSPRKRIEVPHAVVLQNETEADRGNDFGLILEP